MFARSLAAFAAFMLIGAGIAGAQELEDFKVRDAGSLARLCAMPEGSTFHAEARQFCYGYIAGAATVYREMVAAGAMERAVCPKAEPTVEEMRATFAGWIARNPDSRQDDPADGLLRAMATAYPCPQR